MPSFSEYPTLLCLLRLHAHHVIDHNKPFAPQLKAAGFPTADIVLALAGTPQNAAQIMEVISPQGRLGLIEGLSQRNGFK